MQQILEKREVEREPIPPILNEKLKNLLTELCFKKDGIPSLSDLLFVFGWSQAEALALKTKELIENKYTKKVFISGGGGKYSEHMEFLNKPESFYILRAINKKQYPDVKFYSENKSRNTRENILEALKILDFSKYKKILYIAKSHNSKRCYLTLKKFCPATLLLQQTISGFYPGTDRFLNKDTWHTYEFGVRRVWGEFLRIRLYGQRGDIAYDEETANLVKKIESQMQ